MGQIFIWILNQSINAIYLMLAVFVIRLLVKRAPKWMSCALWGLVACKLIMPFSFDSVLSLVPSKEPIPQDIEYMKNPRIETGITVINSAVNPIIENNLSPEPVPNSMNANPMGVVITVGAYIWVTGMLLMLTYFCISWMIVKKKVAFSARVRDNIYIIDGIAGPFIFGVVRPKIYIPDGLDGEKMEYVLEHERSHIRRLDHLWKPLGYLILAVYWFNPLCWLSYILLCKDIEFACDEKVTRDKDKEWKAMYCQTLLECGSNLRQRRMIAACPIAFGEVSIKDRIKSVLNYKKPAFGIILAALVVCVAAAVCFATDPASGRLKNVEGFTFKINGDETTVIEIYNGENYVPLNMELETRDGVFAAMTEIFELKISRKPIDLSRSEERDKTYGIHLLKTPDSYGDFIYFNKDFTLVWVENGVKPTLTYRVIEPDKMSEQYEKLLNLKKQKICYARVTEIQGTLLLVEPVEGSPELASGNLYSLGIQNMEPSPEPEVGDTLQIIYDGDILETYPLQFGNIRKVTVARNVSEKQPQKEQSDTVYSFRGTIFTYAGKDYDLAEITELANEITDCYIIGKYILVEGHVGPKNSLYNVFDTEKECFENNFTGGNLIWHDNDISTCIYSFWSGIYSYGGRKIADLNLQDSEIIREMKFSDDYSEVIVTIETEDTEEMYRTETIKISENNDAP